MTAQLSPLGVQKFYDNNGNPLAFGQLYTYAAGTTNPQATYVDSTQTTQNTNPIQLNFRGECNLWLDPSLAYKFLLVDQFGNTIPNWPVDNIPGGFGSLPVSVNLIPNPTNTFTLGNSTHSWAQLYLGANAAPAYNATSGNIGYYVRTAAEVTASVTPSDFSFPPYDVRRYGADPTGGSTATTTTAFQNAVSIAGANVYIPPGTYSISTGLTPRCAMIYGAGSAIGSSPLSNGSVLKPTSGLGTGALISLTSTGGNYPSILRDFCIDGSLTTNATGIALGTSSGAVHVDVSNIDIGNFTGSSGFGMKVVDTLQTDLRHVYIFGCGTNLQVSGDAGFPTTTRFTECQFDSATVGQGAAILTGFDIVFDDCIFESSAAEGLKIIPGASATCRNIVLNRPWFENNHAAYHLVVDGSAASAAAFVRLNEPYFAVSGGTALAANITGAGADVMFRAPVFTSTAANSIIFQSSAFGRIDQWDNFWSYDGNVSDASAKVMGWEGPLTTYTPTVTGVGSGGSIGTVTVNQARWRRVAVNMLFIEINFTGTVAGTPNYLNVTIPSGFTLKNSFVKYAALVTNNNVEEAGGALADGASAIRFYRMNSVLYAAGTGGGIVQGIFEVVG